MQMSFIFIVFHWPEVGSFRMLRAA